MCFHVLESPLWQLLGEGAEGQRGGRDWLGGSFRWEAWCELREEVELKCVLHAEAMELGDGLALGIERVGGGKDICEVWDLSSWTGRDTVHSQEEQRRRLCLEWIDQNDSGIANTKLLTSLKDRIQSSPWAKSPSTQNLCLSTHLPLSQITFAFYFFNICFWIAASKGSPVPPGLSSHQEKATSSASAWGTLSSSGKLHCEEI